MKRLPVLPVLLVLLGAGCGEEPGFGHLAVVEQGEGPAYAEGSIRFLRVASEDGKVLHDGPVDEIAGGYDDDFFDRRVEAGRYRVERWERSCAGTCNFLDPLSPENRCGQDVEVRRDRRVTVTVMARPSGGCSLRVSR